ARHRGRGGPLFVRARLPHQARSLHLVRGYPARAFHGTLEPALGWGRCWRWAGVSERWLRLLRHAVLLDGRLLGRWIILRLLARALLRRPRRRALPSAR